MNKIVLPGLLCLLFALIPCNSAAQQKSPEIALTFDDFPAHGPLPPGTTRLDIIQKIIRALKDAHVPPAYGFVNGQLVEEQPADISVLKAWREAGFPLANHSWSHMNLNQHSVEEFEADVERNESLLSGLMKNKDWHWLRYPYLAEGDTAEKRQAVRDFLSKRGYKVATVTMSFGDYQWTEPYVRCETKGDAAAVEALRKSYMDAADQSMGFFRQASKTILNRDIPYVLLLHIGEATADRLPALIELYRRRGFKFVSLKEAEKDAFYKSSTDPSQPDGLDSLEGAAKQKGTALPSRPAAPADLATICR